MGESMHIATEMSEELSRYLDLSAMQQKLTAQNMANVDTPGYRTVGFDFATEVERSMEEISARRKRENATGVAIESPALHVSAEKVDGLLERPDGNNVSMDREGLKMADAQLKFRTGIELIRNEFSGILDAIHADSK
jgi:flagellar basal-body rod protein FlgB